MWFRNILLLSLPLLATARPEPSNLNEPKKSPAFFFKGHDLSSLKTMEDAGFIYKDTTRHNQTRTADAILASGGMNTVRLRIWVNPVGGTNGYEYTLALARRFKKAGYKLYLDFHFSDYWADPNKQPPPAGWPLALGPLSKTLREYVSCKLADFHEDGINWDLVSLGNEIRHGILWPTGYVDVDTQPASALVKNFTQLATLWKSARAGVDDAIARTHMPKPQIMIHIDDGWNLTLQQRWFGAMVDNGVPLSAWDVFGFSFYPFYGTAATFANLRQTLHTLALEYKKPLQVVETDYPAVCNGEYNPIPTSSEPEVPYSIPGQTEWTDDVIDIVRSVPNGLGQGVHYWEPAWLNNTGLGSACNDAILFSQDWSESPVCIGYSRPSVNLFNH